MKIEEIISSLRDQIDDRESLIPPDDPDSIFKHDAEALREAVKLIEQLRSANAILQGAKEVAEQERDAAIRDLEKIMFVGGKNIDTCNYCGIKTCYSRGGHRLCAPVWRGRQKGGAGMKKLELFQCEVCGTQFKSKEECARCEKGHQKELHIVKARYLPYTQDASGMPAAITFAGPDGTHYTYKR